MFNKLKQFKDLKDRAKQIQSALGQESTEGEAGWGKIKVKIDGNQQVLSVAIDPSVMDNREKLEGLVKDAVNDAIKKIQQIMTRKLKDIGGLDIASEFGEAIKK
jgi:DNA-binding YbaB/EbfC family protein